MFRNSTVVRVWESCRSSLLHPERIPSFASISGKTRIADSRRASRFFWLRFGRIYPVHLVTLILSGVLFAWGISLTHGGHSANRAIANLLLIHPWDPAFQLSWNYPSWSISSEWFAYLMFPFLAILLSRLHWFAIVLFFVLMVGSSIAVLVMQKELPFRGILAVVPTFAGGAALAVICPPGSGKNVRYLDLVLFLSIVGVSFVFSTEWQKGIDLWLFFALIAVRGKMGANSG